MLYRELEFPLKEIKELINSENFNKGLALDQQINLLLLKKEHLENLILYAKGLKTLGGNIMDFAVFDTKKIDAYAKQAKEAWRNTSEWKEFEDKDKRRSTEETKVIYHKLMLIFAEFSKLRLKKWCKAISLLPSNLHYATSLQALKSLSITCKRWSIVSCVHCSFLGRSSKRRECLSMKCVATNHSSF